MTLIFSGELQLGSWRLLQVVLMYGDMICAPYGVRKSKNFTFFEVLHGFWMLTWYLAERAWISKKSLLTYVCVHRICSKPRTVISFVSDNRYDHLKALEHSHDVIWRRRKFSESDWNRAVFLEKSYLFEVCPVRTLSKSISFFKNHRELTFAAIEFFLRLIRPSRLLLRVSMIICKPPSTHITSREHVEIFSEATKVAVPTL